MFTFLISPLMFIETLWVISTPVSRGMVSVELGTTGDGQCRVGDYSLRVYLVIQRSQGRPSDHP